MIKLANFNGQSKLRTGSKSWHWPAALLAITILATALRLYYVTTALILDPVRGDAAQYYSYAWNIAHHATFAKDAPGSLVLHPDNFRDPGYPLFLATWMKVLGAGDSWYACVLLCQALLGGLTVTFSTQLGRYWLPARRAIFAGLLMSVWPHSITINSFLLSETLFGFLCSLGMLLCVKAIRQKRVLTSAISGMVFGAAALTNAVLLPFAVILAIALNFCNLASRKICFAIFLGSVLIPAAWAIRNTQIPTPPAGGSSSDRALVTFVVGAWPDFASAWHAQFSDDEEARAKGKQLLATYQAEADALQKDRAGGGKLIMQRLSKQPARYAYWYLIEKPRLLWGWDIQIGQGDIYVYATRRSPFNTNPLWIALYAICRASNTLLMLLALASAFFVGSKSSPLFDHWASVERSAPAATICLVAFITVVYTTLQAEPRYSIALRSFEMLLATTSLYGFSAWKKRLGA